LPSAEIKAKKSPLRRFRQHFLVEKWEADSLSKTMNVYEKYTRKAAEQGADIVVLAESRFR
jgi:hypothetical protein